MRFIHQHHRILRSFDPELKRLLMFVQLWQYSTYLQMKLALISVLMKEVADYEFLILGLLSLWSDTMLGDRSFEEACIGFIINCEDFTVYCFDWNLKRLDTLIY